MPNINQILSFICIGLERAVLRTFVANFTILQFMRSIRKVFGFPDSDVVTVGVLSFCYHFYRLLLLFVPTHHSFILLFNICDHGFLKRGAGGGLCQTEGATENGVGSHPQTYGQVGSAPYTL